MISLIKNFISGAIGGGAIVLIGHYITYQNNTFNNDLKIYQESVKGYEKRIQLNHELGNFEKEKGLKITLDQYIENWQNSQKLSNYVSSIKALNTIKVTEVEATEIKSLLKKIEKTNAFVRPEDLGAAYYVIGEYEKALEELSLAVDQNPSDDLKILRAAAVISASKKNKKTSIIKEADIEKAIKQTNIKLNKKQKKFLIESTGNEAVRALLN